MINRYFSSSILDFNPKLIKRIEDQAKRGFAEDMYTLGVIHLDASFGVKNVVEAKQWFHQAAKRGFTPAMLELAYLYLDDKEAEFQSVGVTWLEKAATMGSIEARNLLRFIQSNTIK